MKIDLSLVTKDLKTKVSSNTKILSVSLSFLIFKR